LDHGSYVGVLRVGDPQDVRRQAEMPGEPAQGSTSEIARRSFSIMEM
jgi:hypothetical protein